MSIPPPQPISLDFSITLTELYVSHWKKVKQFCPSLQLVLWFPSDAQSLCDEVGYLINNSMLIIGLKFPIAQTLIQLLYSALKEELREKGIADHRQLIKRTNVFINHHRIIMKVSAALAPLQFSVPDIKQRVKKFVSRGLPSPFPLDSSMLWIEQVLQWIKILQQDRVFLQWLGSPISVNEVEGLFYPLAQLSTLLNQVQDEPVPLPLDEVIFLEQYFQELEA